MFHRACSRRVQHLDGALTVALAFTVLVGCGASPTATCQVTSLSETLPLAHTLQHGSQPQGILASWPGPDSGIWFTEGFGDRVEFLPAPSASASGPLPAPTASEGVDVAPSINNGLSAFPAGIIRTSDGYLWVTVTRNKQIWEIDPMHHHIGTWTLPTTPTIAPYDGDPTYEGPWHILGDAMGRLWFTERDTPFLWMLDPSSGLFTPYTRYHVPVRPETPLPPAPGDFRGLTQDFHGHLWIADALGSIDEFDLATTQLKQPFAPSGAHVFLDVAWTPPNDLWTLDQTSNTIWKANLDTSPPTFAEQCPIPTANSLPVGITVTANGFVWFTESGTGKIGWFNPQKCANSNDVHEYPPTLSNKSPQGITADASGNLWFTETDGDMIGELKVQCTA
jgi:virginiamycin B lyase